VLRKFSIEADFLVSFELDDPAVMDHELDGTVPNRPQGLPELPQEGLGEWQWLVWPGLQARREGRMIVHDPI
jgi:hypothetical protein